MVRVGIGRGQDAQIPRPSTAQRTLTKFRAISVMPPPPNLCIYVQSICRRFGHVVCATTVET